MAILVFKGLKPISINSAYYRNKKLTMKARRFRTDFLCLLHSQLSEIQHIKSTFNPTKHSIAISYKFFIPKQFFYTKQGHISLRSQDLDNCLKLITDFTFNPKYEDNVGIDDKFITKLTAEKLPDTEYRIELSISLIDL